MPLSLFVPRVLILLSLCLKIAFSVFMAFLSSSSSGVGSLFSSTSSFPPFFAPFLSSFLGGAPLPPFLFLSSLTSYYLLSNLKAYEISLSSLAATPSLYISRALTVSLFI